jgi:hypothetical protein
MVVHVVPTAALNKHCGCGFAPLAGASVWTVIVALSLERT